MQKYKQWLLVPAILVSGFVISKVLSNQTQEMKRKPQGSQQKTVRLITVNNGDITVPIRLTGPLRAYDKAEIYAEVSGVLMETEKRLKTGHVYKKGEMLVYIDDRVFRNSVLSQKSGLLNQMTQLIPDLSIDYPGSVESWKTYLNNFDLNHPMKPLPEPSSTTERYYIASRNLYTQFYAVRSMEETLAKYRIAAPFNGMVTDAQVNPGTLIRSGTQIATLTSNGHFEMVATASPRLVNRLKSGQSAVLKCEDLNGSFSARITRINSVIDASSQTIRVFLETRDKRLRDGLYLSAEIQTEPIHNAIRIPKTLLVKGNQVFLVVNGKLELTRINVAAEDGDHIIVQGLTDGQQILGEKFAGVKVGMILPSPGKSNPGRPAGQGEPVNSSSPKKGNGESR